MASKTLGRVKCPINCGHDAAQVKVKTDKPTGIAYPYVHCASCGVQLHTKNEEQSRLLLAITRPEKGAVDAPAAPPSPEPAPEDTVTPPPPKKAPGGLFDGGFFGRPA